jgi:hypothetical protein
MICNKCTNLFQNEIISKCLVTNEKLNPVAGIKKCTHFVEPVGYRFCEKCGKKTFHHSLIGSDKCSECGEEIKDNETRN